MFKHTQNIVLSLSFVCLYKILILSIVNRKCQKIKLKFDLLATNSKAPNHLSNFSVSVKLKIDHTVYNSSL